MSQPHTFPTPQRDLRARLSHAEEEEALYTNGWRANLGNRIRLNLNPPPPVIAARRY